MSNEEQQQKLIEATNAVILTLPALEQHVITMRFGVLIGIIVNTYSPKDNKTTVDIFPK